MSGCDDFIEKMEKELPEQCSVSDLVTKGIYKSAQSAFHARRLGDCPSYFQLGKRIMYPRKDVIEWLKNKKHETTQTKNPCDFTSKITHLPKQSRVENRCRP